MVAKKTEDYYELLGLERTASKEEIRKRYREIAKKLHPDVAGPGKEEEFKRVSEAYEVLSNDKLRERYDRFGKEGVQQEFGAGGFDWSKFTHMGDIFDLFGFGDQTTNANENLGGFSEMFGNFFGQGQTGRRGSNVSSIADLQMAIKLTIPESLTSSPIAKQIRYHRQEMCQACQGHGGSGTKVRCTECQGMGYITERLGQGMFQIATQRVCPKCLGAREQWQTACRSCKSSGTHQVKTEVEIDDLRKYINQVIVFRSKGNYIKDRGYGALEVTVLVEGDNQFQVINRTDLVHSTTINVFTALVGGRLKISNPTDYSQQVILDVPSPADLNEIRIKVPNMGLFQNPTTSKRGSLFLVLRLIKPSLTEEERRAITALRDNRERY